MAINSKNKGNKNEREVAKWWESWTGMEFQRVPQSGGLRWANADKISGDIICTDPKHGKFFQFSIECKSYQDLDFKPPLLGNKGDKLQAFWKQAMDDAERSGKEPILFMRKNGMPKGQFFVAVNMRIDIMDKMKNRHNFYVLHLAELKETIYIFNSNVLLELDYRKTHKKIKQWRRKQS